MSLYLPPAESDVADEEPGKNDGFIAPYVCWSKERIDSDLKLSTELVQKLDAEKGIESNPVLSMVLEMQAGLGLIGREMPNQVT